MTRDAFALDPAVVHLNHGSFGAVPRAVTRAQARVRARAEANPMRFHRVEVPRLKSAAREVAAEFLGVAADEVALVRNVTQAAATVLTSVASHDGLTADDVIVLTDQTYGSVHQLVRRTCERTSASYEIIDCPVGAADDTVVSAYRATLDRLRADGLRPRLVMLDEVASPTAAVMPVRRICAAAREAGAYSFVDGAHAPGQVPARPADTGADFWTGTWHKWVCAPRGTTALWAAPGVRSGLAPLASGMPLGIEYPFPFDYTGTDDYTGWFVLDGAVEFWRDHGGADIAARCSSLLDTGAAVVRAVLPPSDVPVPATSAPCMRLVPLPGAAAATPVAANALYEQLSARGYEVQIVSHGGHGYVRLSASLYNEPADYERFAQILPEALVLNA